MLKIGDRVIIKDIYWSDAYYYDRAHYIGRTATVIREIKQINGNHYRGWFEFDNYGTRSSRFVCFANVELEEINHENG